ncbi:hypothetical protein Tco_0674270 [Tanacetum coccineum]
MNSLITFIKSRMIWERVHDFQLGIESYQIKVNLTAPTLTVPRIEAHEPFSIVDKPSTGLIYLNSKDKKQVMYLTEMSYMSGMVSVHGLCQMVLGGVERQCSKLNDVILVVVRVVECSDGMRSAKLGIWYLNDARILLRKGVSIPVLLRARGSLTKCKIAESEWVPGKMPS